MDKAAGDEYLVAVKLGEGEALEVLVVRPALVGEVGQGNLRPSIRGINDDGLFVGSFTDADGDTHAFYSVFPTCNEDAGSIIYSTSTSILPNNQTRGLAVGADGNSYAVSHAWTDDSFSDYFNQLVARTETGEIDSTYGVDGVVALNGPVPAFWEFLYPLPFSDGRFAVVGSAFDIDISTVAFVTADGAIDSSRGDDGYALFDSFRAFDGIIDADNRIVVVGDRFGGPSGFVARLTVDGELDPTFGDGGLFEVSHPDGTLKFRSVSLGADATIVAAGTLETDPPARDVVLVTVTPDGKNLREDFGVGGVARPAPQIERGIGWRLAHDESGGLIVGGFQGTFGSRDGFVLRVSAIDGTLDTDFGDEGVRVLEEGFVTALVLTSDYIWVGGQAGDFGNEMGWSVWRLLWSGDLDECIEDGQIILDGQNVTGMAELADGTILLHGIDSVGALTVRGSLVLFRNQQGKARRVSAIKTGTAPQGVVFTKDSRRLLVQLNVDKAIAVYEVRGGRLHDTKQRIELTGGPTSIRSMPRGRP